MAEDRSLDDFAEADAAESAADGSADSDGDSEDPDAAEDGSLAPEGAEDDADPDAVEDDVDPAVATSTWHADGAECDRCGERVERRWREEGALVCADCASW